MVYITEKKQNTFKMLVEHTASYIFSSDTANGARNKSSDGHSFDVELNEPISIPKEAVNCTLEVSQARIWYTTPNISAALGNNKLYFQVAAVYNPATLVTLTFPDGLYSVSGLNNQLGLLLNAALYDSDLITIAANNATQQTVITAKDLNVIIDFSQADTIREILGFNSGVIGPSTAGETFPSNNIANFNTLNSYLMHSDIVSNGIPVNNTGANIIASIPITSSPGSQIIYQPFNPDRCSLNELIGFPRNSFRIWLTNQNNEPLDTNNENYSLVVVIRYQLPIERDSHERQGYFQHSH